jgi:sortase B
MKNKKNVNKAFFALAFVGVAAACVCAYMFVRETNIKNEGRDYYTALVSMVDTPATPKKVELDDVTNRNPITITQNDWTPAVDFDALAAIYPDIKAWITVSGTDINYPIMQGTDNDFYLHHLPDGTPHKMGSVYMDFLAKPDFSSQNTLLFGHHLRAGGMFTDLEKYKSQSFYDENPVLTLHTREKDYAVLIFSGHVVSGSTPFLERGFADSGAFDEYIRELKKLSVFTGKDETFPETGDRLVSLITCSYEFKNARFILTGKLVETGGV